MHARKSFHMPASMAFERDARDMVSTATVPSRSSAAEHDGRSMSRVDASSKLSCDVSPRRDASSPSCARWSTRARRSPPPRAPTDALVSTARLPPRVARTARAERRANEPSRRWDFFETFDGDAVLAVKDAMDQAKKLRSSELGSEHVLLALTRARDRTSKALHKGGVTEESTRRALGGSAGVAVGTHESV